VRLFVAICAAKKENCRHSQQRQPRGAPRESLES
jgi:hypothetical protein